MDEKIEKTKEEQIKYSVEQIIKYRPDVLKNRKQNRIANALIAGTAALGILYANVLIPNLDSNKFMQVVDTIIHAALYGTSLAAISAKVAAVKQKLNLAEKIGELTGRKYANEVREELGKRIDEIKQQEKETGGMSR